MRRRGRLLGWGGKGSGLDWAASEGRDLRGEGLGRGPSVEWRKKVYGRTQRDPIDERLVPSGKGIAGAMELIAGAAAATPWMEGHTGEARFLHKPWMVVFQESVEKETFPGTLRERELSLDCSRGRGGMREGCAGGAGCRRDAAAGGAGCTGGRTCTGVWTPTLGL
jgi:hypothetical protein